MASSAPSLLVLVTCLSLLGQALSLNERPIIGIVSEATSQSHTSYIAASYVKYIESAGGRVVPILNNSTQDELETMFKSVNGILFPGGGVSLDKSDYAKVGEAVLQMAKEANDGGDYFPVWGTCLGFELLCHLVGGSVISSVDAENYSIPLNLTSAAKTSRLFSLFPDEALQWISTESLTMNNHQYGVTTETFQSNQNLSTFYTVLSTNRDRKGVEFVSSIEAKHYPFYAVQWHPEKNGFEWTTREGINHTEHAVAIMQYTADLFVQEARKSYHKFASESEEERALIYNYSPTFTQSVSSFTQIYFFS